MAQRSHEAHAKALEIVDDVVERVDLELAPVERADSSKKARKARAFCCIEVELIALPLRAALTVRYARQGSNRTDRCQRQSQLQLRHA